jgi:hypothetical protein
MPLEDDRKLLTHFRAGAREACIIFEQCWRLCMAAHDGEDHDCDGKTDCEDSECLACVACGC